MDRQRRLGIAALAVAALGVMALGIWRAGCTEVVTDFRDDLSLAGDMEETAESAAGWSFQGTDIHIQGERL